MVRTGWASKEEREYLTSLMPEYEACQVRRRYKTFWQRVNAEFLTKFPVMDKLFPGRKITDLLPEEKEMYTAAVARQQQASCRLKEWFRWQLNPRSRNTGTVLSKKDLRNIYHGRTRTLKPYEVFAKVHPMEVEIAKKARCESMGISGRDTLTVWHEVAKELYQSADEEQLEAVTKRMAQDQDADDAQVEDKEPRNYIRYLRKLPALLDATLTPAVRKAGVLAFVTIVGPEPEQNGKITCKSFQFGDKPDTPVFSQVWEDHDTVFSEELARFARRHEFPPDVCAARSVNHAAVAGLHTDQLEQAEPIQDVSQSGAPSGIATQVPGEPAISVPKESPSKTQVSASTNINPPPERTDANQASPASSRTGSSNAHPSFSVSKTSSYKAPFFHDRLEDSADNGQQDDARNATRGRSGKEDVSAAGALFLRRGDESDEEEDDKYENSMFQLTQEKWDEIDRRLQATHSSAPIIPANVPAPLHTFAALGQPAQSSVPPSTPSYRLIADDASQFSFGDDINMFDDRAEPEPIRSMTRTSMVRTTMGRASPAPRFEPSATSPRERPRPRPTMTRSRPSLFNNDKQSTLQFDQFNLSQKRSQSEISTPSHCAPPVSSFDASIGRGLSSNSSSSTRLPSAQASQSLSQRTTSSGWPSQSQPSRASQFLSSFLDGNKAGTRSETPVPIDIPEVCFPEPKRIDDITPPPSKASSIANAASQEDSLSPRGASQLPPASHGFSAQTRDALYAPSPFCMTPLPEYGPARIDPAGRLPDPISANFNTFNVEAFGLTNATSQDDWSPDGPFQLPPSFEVPSMQNVAHSSTSYFDAPASTFPAGSPTVYNPAHLLDDSITRQNRTETRGEGDSRSAMSPFLEDGLARSPCRPSLPDLSSNHPDLLPTITDPLPNPAEDRSEVPPRQPNPSGPTSRRTSPPDPLEIPPPLVEASAVVPRQPSLSRPASPITIDNPPPPEKPAPAPTANAPPPPQSNDELQGESTLDTNRRRSTRGSVPSKRHEQLQKIGTNATRASETLDASPPAWFVLALENLESYKLGEDWSKLIDKWAVLECAMGHGKLCKGSLGAKGRPEEWTKWTAKNWQGTRRYDKAPMVDPADLAIAMWKWWNSLQPSFRASEAAFPLPIFSLPDPSDGADAWATLRKSGPNGFVSILMLLAWWGKAAMSERPEWEEDSLESWHRLAQDVMCVLDAMTSSGCEPPSDTGTKRPLDKENAVPASSRKKRKHV